ncbi:hypothetical protein GCM10010990_25610 [Croceicoccus mobilis]|uniref:Transposase n=1 Tax=Croceicoccus mobilis TaxID=1703339 RepID=A0A917DVM1_9SPHN|nr:hypothetical protein GCM10010990_25610 [Croceicoccus mobilis]
MTLVEVQARLIERGTSVGIGTVHRFFVRHGITRKKKTGHAIEQDRPDVLRQRQHWFDNQLDLEPERLVFIEETWTATNMTRSHGRCPKGERLRMGFPHGHRKTTTLAHDRHDRADGARRSDQRRLVRSLCGAGSGA